MKSFEKEWQRIDRAMKRLLFAYAFGGAGLLLTILSGPQNIRAMSPILFMLLIGAVAAIVISVGGYFFDGLDGDEDPKPDVAMFKTKPLQTKDGEWP